MRKATIAVIALVLLALLPLPQARAGQILYLNFEGFSMTQFSSGASVSNTGTTWTLVDTFTLSLPTRKYLNGVMVDWTLQYSDSNGDGVYGTAYGAVKVVIASSSASSNTHSFTAGAVFSKNYIDAFGFTGLYGDTFTISVYAEAYGGQSGDTIKTIINNVYVYTSDEDYVVKSKLTELKYIPPGAADTPEGLLLNQTEVELGKTYNLSTGTIAFWLKWDGSKNIKITDSIGIDDNGYIYVKNSDGTVYTLQGMNPPVGTYVPIYIGWQNGEGYIMLNTTKISLNWAGTLTISKVGELNNESSTLVDEFKVWNTYIPPDQVIYTSQQNEYTLIWNGKAISIAPEGGNSLGAINVYFLNSSLDQINTTTLSPGQPTWEVPSGTYEVTLERGEVSRTYVLSQLNSTEIAFPAENTTLAALNVKVVSGAWQYFIVKTVDGKIATATQLNGGSAGFTALLGREYLFEFIKDNLTRVRTYTVTGSGDVAFYLPPLDANLTPPIDVEAFYQDGLITVSYLDSENRTNYINVTLTGYQHFNKAWELHDEEHGSWGLFVLKTNSSADYVEVTLTANVSGEMRTFHRTVYLGGPDAKTSPFPQNLVPPALIFLFTSLVGLFVFNEPGLMLLGGAGALGLVTILGWIPAVPGVIAVLSMLGVLGLIMSRR